MTTVGPTTTARTGTRPTVAELMVRAPKTLPADASVAEVRAALDDDHVVMVLLTAGPVLRGTLLHDDLPPDAGPTTSALALSRLTGRTVGPREAASAAHRRLVQDGRRRLAVVDADGRLLGLLCLKRRRTGFCSDADVAARCRANDRGAQPALDLHTNATEHMLVI